MTASLQQMTPRNHQEAVWQTLPEGLEPEDFAIRRDFLRGNVRAGRRVLDLGCGEGVFASELLAAGADVLAADIAEEPLRRARAREPRLQTALLGDAAGGGVPAAAFVVVWAGEVVAHGPDTAGWFSELRRVLRPAGLLLLSTPAVGRSQLLAAALSRRAFASRFEPRADHLRFYSRALLAEVIGEFGFEQISVRGAGGTPWTRRRLLARAVRGRW